MKAETLKKAILQYAMQGKLAAQDPNDEPASVLLERIKTEKEQLIKDGKIKIEKPLPPITEDEIPYELPKGWEWMRLGELGISNIGLTYSPTDITTSTNGIPVLRSSNIQNNKIDLNDLVRVTTAIKNVNLFVKKGDILICARNGSKHLVGKSAIIEELDEPMTFGAFMAIFRSNINNWVKVYLDSPLFKKTLESVNTVTINQITQSNLKNAIIPIPPLAEQQRIVERLEQILPLVEEYGKNEEKLSKLNSTLPDKIKQSILQHAVQGKLVPQNPSDEPASVLLNRIKAEKEQLIKDGKIKKEKILPPITEDEIPFQIPNSWEWTKIRNIAFVTKLAGFEYTKYINLQDSGEIPVIRAQNVKPFSLNLANLKYIDTDTSEMLERSALTKPCLLMTFIGAGIGDVAIFDKNSRFHLAPNVAKIEFYNQHNNIDNRYAMYYLLSNYGKQEVFKFLKATAQPSLSMDTIREVMIPLPPLAEQQRIVTKVEELLTVVDKLKG